MNPDGTQDRNLIQLDCAKAAVQDFGDLNGTGYTGVFKYTSQQKGPLKVTAGTVVGGSETLIDINNGGSGMDIVARVWDVSPCKYGVSIKGGSCGNYVQGVVRGRSKECEVFLDNWSDQSHAPSSGNLLDLRPEDGVTPIRVRYLLDKPAFAPGSGPYEFIFPGPWVPLPRWLVYKGFNELRRHAWTAKLFGLT